MELIIKADMPKACAYCFAYDDEYCQCRLEPSLDGHWRRDNHCPILREIPAKHGRLVEADEIADAIIESERNGEITGGEAGLFTAIVHNAKTIIPSTIH